MTPVNLRNEFWVAEVPAYASNFIIDMGYLIYKVPNYNNWVNDDILCDYNKLQKHLAKHRAEDDFITTGMPLAGSWQIICTTKEVTEEVKDVLEKVIYPNEPVYYKLYDQDSDATATTDFEQALHSLLRSVNLNTDNNHLIIKKQ